MGGHPVKPGVPGCALVGSFACSQARLSMWSRAPPLQSTRANFFCWLYLKFGRATVLYTAVKIQGRTRRATHLASCPRHTASRPLPPLWVRHLVGLWLHGGLHRPQLLLPRWALHKQPILVVGVQLGGLELPHGLGCGARAGVGVQA